MDQAGRKLVYQGWDDAYLLDIASKSAPPIAGYSGPSSAAVGRPPFVEQQAPAPLISGDGRYVFYQRGYAAAAAGSPTLSQPVGDVYWYRREIQATTAEKFLARPRNPV